VNIHPTKKEIRFEKEEGIYAAVYEAISRGLEKKGICNTGQKATKLIEGEYDPVERIGAWKDDIPAEPEHFQTTLAEPSPVRSDAKGVCEGGDGWAETGFGVEPPFYNDYRENFHRHELPLLYPMGQIHGLYIIARSQDGLVLIDQHALHERIMLERVTDQYNRRSTAIQEMIVPLDIEFTPKQSTVFDRWKDKIERMGFGIEHFGDRHYKVRNIPRVIRLKRVKGLVCDIIDMLSERGKDVSLEEMEEELLKMTACRSAIKAGDVLDRNGINDLFSRMYRARNPYFCAHGRPTMVKITLGELEKRFKRRV